MFDLTPTEKTVLSRFVDGVFVQTYASHGKNEYEQFAYGRMVPKAKAFDYPYCKANGPRRLGSVNLDFDFLITPEHFDRLGFPRPNLLIRDKKTGKGHAAMATRQNRL